MISACETPRDARQYAGLAEVAGGTIMGCFVSGVDVSSEIVLHTAWKVADVDSMVVRLRVSSQGL